MDLPLPSEPLVLADGGRGVLALSGEEARGFLQGLVTNDVDEGLLLADRIVPLSHGPAATLGPSIPVTAARPRDRKTINDEPSLCAARAQVLDYLLSSSGRPRPPRSGPQLVTRPEASDSARTAEDLCA